MDPARGRVPGAPVAPHSFATGRPRAAIRFEIHWQTITCHSAAPPRRAAVRSAPAPSAPRRERFRPVAGMAADHRAAFADIIVPGTPARELAMRCFGLPPVLAPTTTTDTVGPALVLSLVPHRGFVWQGQSLQVDWILRNRGDQPATNVRLWGLLPTALQFAALTLDGGAASPPGLVEAQPERAKAGSVALFWPAIAPGAQVTATVTVTIAPDTANGVFIDLVALAEAAESGRTVGGISIAMPPTRLPIFR